jgi:cyclomaltodextrinase
MAFIRWVRDYHVDGFRLDAAWAVRERAPEFWPHLIRLVRRINPDVGLIAEGSALDPYYALNGFDATYELIRADARLMPRAVNLG